MSIADSVDVIACTVMFLSAEHLCPCPGAQAGAGEVSITLCCAAGAAPDQPPPLTALTTLTGLRSLACSARGASAEQLAALAPALARLTSLELRDMEERAAPALAQLAEGLPALASLSVPCFLQFCFLRRYCRRLPAAAFTRLMHLQVDPAG